MRVSGHVNPAPLPRSGGIFTAMILTDLRDGVLSITVHRPDKLNSFNHAMADALLEAFRRAADDGAVRAVLLTGAGGAVCAGQGLAEVKPGEGRAIPHLGGGVRRPDTPIIKGHPPPEK